MDGILLHMSTGLQLFLILEHFLMGNIFQGCFFFFTELERAWTLNLQAAAAVHVRIKNQALSHYANNAIAIDTKSTFSKIQAMQESEVCVVEINPGFDIYENGSAGNEDYKFAICPKA